MLISLTLLIVIPALLLAVPVDISIGIRRSGTVTGHLIVTWLFGRVRIGRRRKQDDKPPRHTDGASRPTGVKVKESKQEASDARKASRRQSLFDVLGIIQSRGFVKRSVRLLRQLASRVKIRTLLITGTVGLGDPAQTGRFWGILSMLIGFSAAIQGPVIQLKPDFEQAILEFNGQGAFRIIPLQIGIIILIYLLSPPTMRAGWVGLKAALRARKMNRAATAQPQPVA